MRIDELLRIEGEYRQVVLRVDADQLLSAELEDLNRGLAWQRKHNLDTVLAKDVDLAIAVFALASAHSQEGLNRVVGDLSDFGIYAIIPNLGLVSQVVLFSRAGKHGIAGRGRGSAYMIEHKEIRPKAGGKVVVNTGLFPADEMGHGGVVVSLFKVHLLCRKAAFVVLGFAWVTRLRATSFGNLRVVNAGSTSTRRDHKCTTITFYDARCLVLSTGTLIHFSSLATLLTVVLQYTSEQS